MNEIMKEGPSLSGGSLKTAMSEIGTGLMGTASLTYSYTNCCCWFGSWFDSWYPP